MDCDLGEVIKTDLYTGDTMHHTVGWCRRDTSPLCDALLRIIRDLDSVLLYLCGKSEGLNGVDRDSVQSIQ